MQHANLEEAPLLRPKTPISSQVLVTRMFSRQVWWWQSLINILQTAFFLSATVCMWVMAFQLLRDLLVSNQTHTSSTGESRRLISSGLGEEGHTMAEEISSSVPRRMYKRPVSVCIDATDWIWYLAVDTQLWIFCIEHKFQIQDSQNATHAEEVSLRKGWAIIVPSTLISGQYCRT